MGIEPAPMTASWAVENRTCAVRAIPGGPKSTRLEYRQTAADMNPYIAMATALAAGLYGVEKKLPCPAPATGDASADESVGRVPRSLRAATEQLAASKAAREILGDAFVDHYVRTRDWPSAFTWSASVESAPFPKTMVVGKLQRTSLIGRRS